MDGNTGSLVEDGWPSKKGLKPRSCLSCFSLPFSGFDFLYLSRFLDSFCHVLVSFSTFRSISYDRFLILVFLLTYFLFSYPLCISLVGLVFTLSFLLDLLFFVIFLSFFFLVDLPPASSCLSLFLFLTLTRGIVPLRSRRKVNECGVIVTAEVEARTNLTNKTFIHYIFRCDDV